MSDGVDADEINAEHDVIEKDDMFKCERCGKLATSQNKLEMTKCSVGAD